jgi:plastocyanin
MILVVKNISIIIASVILLGIGYFLIKPKASLSPSTTNTNIVVDKTFTVQAANYSFDVKEIRVKLNDKVRIVFTNNDGFHDWNLDEFNAHSQKISAGQTDSVTFTADKAGTFEYYCSVSNRRSQGMVGKLIVE